MELNVFNTGRLSLRLPRKLVLVMQLIVIILTTCLFQVSAAGFAQNITYKQKDASLKQIFKEIRKQTGYNVLSSAKQLESAGSMDVNFNQTPLEEVLKICLENESITYTIKNRTILIKQKDKDKVTINFKQNVDVRGKVVDENGLPLPGASIQIKGTASATITNEAGEFNIKNVPENSTLIVSYLGFISQEITDFSKPVTITLKEDKQGLNEVVVVGYGKQKRVSMTSAVSTVSAADLTERTNKNLSSGLQGLAPGLTVIDKGGSPGSSDFNIFIRGVTTLGNNNPLVIVDGVEMGINDVDPNNVESVSVLKDAASTAIYGSRGANGVLLITTKRGKVGRIKINYNTSLDLQNLTVEPEHMETEAYLQLKNDAYVNSGSNPLYTEDLIQKYVSGEDRLKYPLPNTFFDAVIQDNAPMQRHALSFSGGTDMMRTNVMLNFFDQKGIYPGQNTQQYRIRMNNDIKLSEALKLSLDLNFRKQDRYTFRDEDNVYNRMLHSSQFAVPRYPDGTYGLSPQGHSPLAWTDPKIVGETNAATDAGIINMQGTWNIVKGLSLTSQYAADFSKYSSLTNIPTYQIRDYFNNNIIRKKNDVNQLSENRNESLQTTWNNTLTYSLKKGVHDIGALAGYSEISYDYKLANSNGRNFYNNDLRDLSLGDPLNRSINSSYTDWGLRSYFGRLNYSFKEKYIAEFSMRYDGSSRFPEGKNRYTIFPSVAAAWRVSEESFWEPLRNTIEEFKIRGTWGITGNQNVPLYTFYENLDLANYYVFNDVPVTGVRQTTFASRDLTWETTTQSNLGFDLGMFNSKLNVTFDWFDKVTEDILLTLPIPGLAGLSPTSTNAGSVQNKGWEIQLNHRNNINGFRYGVTVNFSDVRNKILDLAGTGPYYEGTWLTNQEGQPIDALFGYATDGLLTQADIDNAYPVFGSDATAGDIKYVDRSGPNGVPDGKITADDRTIIGSTIPRLTYGTSFDLGWKNFDFNLQFQGIGNKDLALEGALIEAGTWEGFTVDIAKDYWTPQNTDARFPRPQRSQKKNTQPSDWWVVNGAYLRLKNLQFGYSLPTTITERVGVSKLRMFVGGTNLFTVSDLNDWGIDAEAATGRGIFYPATKTYTFGLNIAL